MIGIKRGAGAIAQARKSVQALFVWVFALSIAGAPPANADELAYALEIPAQDLDGALKTLAVETDKQVLFAASDVKGHTSPEINGEYNTFDAMDLLLADTGLVYEVTRSDVLLVKPNDEASDKGGDSDSKNSSPAPVLMAQNRTSTKNDTSRTGSTIEDSSENDSNPEPLLEEIVVVGTHLRGISNDSSPVLSFDREEIEKTGFSTTQEFIQSLPQNFGGGAAEDTAGFVFDRGNASLNPGFGSGVNLRGMGNDATLVLINGRRVAPGGFGTFVDVSLIPISAIDQVDVLTDGASATYGSDAVAGVVNFVLRDDYDGAETDLRYGTVTEGDSREYKIGQTFGRNWNTGNAILSYEYLDRSNLDSQDRSFSEDLRDQTDLFPDQQRHGLLVSATQEISEATEVFGYGLYSNRDTSSFFANPNTMVDTRNDSNTEQYSLSAGISFDIHRRWRGELVAGSAQSDTGREVTDIGTSALLATTDTSSSVWSIDGKVDGPIGNLTGGEVRVAIGGQYRDESLDVDSGVLLFDIKRDVVAAFAEAFFPIVGETNQLPGVERLEITAAVRHEDYSDFGSTTNPKIGFLWSPVASLSLRATYGTSFRAPLLFELDTSSLSGLLADLPNPSSPTGTSLSLIAFGFGPEGTALEPEEAETRTFGLDFSPRSLPGLNLEVTYFDIDFDNRIAETNAFFDAFTDPELASVLVSPVPSDIVTALTSLPPGSFFNLTTSDPEDAEYLVDNRRRNVAFTEVSGIDVILNHAWDKGHSDFGLGLNASYLLDYKERLTASSPIVELVDTVFNPADLKIRAGISWNHESGFSTNVFVNYTDSYTDDQLDPVEEVDSWTTLDVTLRYSVPGAAENRLLSGTTFALSVQNAFDSDPPLVNDLGFANLTGMGFDPENASPLGRFVALQITKDW